MLSATARGWLRGVTRDGAFMVPTQLEAMRSTGCLWSLIWRQFSVLLDLVSDWTNCGNKARVILAGLKHRVNEVAYPALVIRATDELGYLLLVICVGCDERVEIPTRCGFG